MSRNGVVPEARTRSFRQIRENAGQALVPAPPGALAAGSAPMRSPSHCMFCTCGWSYEVVHTYSCRL